MPRVLRGHRAEIPEGVSPTLWADLVWDEMDKGRTEDEAKQIVKSRLEEKNSGD